MTCGTRKSSSLPYRTNARDCGCLDPLIWDRGLSQCRCTTPTAILTMSGTSRTCQDCLSVQGGIAKQNITTCTCATGLVWISTSYQCGCPVTTAILYGSGASTICVDCATLLNGNGKASSTACNCQPTYTWDAPTATCVPVISR